MRLIDLLYLLGVATAFALGTVLGQYFGHNRAYWEGYENGIRRDKEMKYFERPRR